MSKIKKLAGETAIYGLGSIVPRLLNFLLFPLQTRIFHPQDYGVISYLYVFVALLNIVYTFGLETAYFRYATKPGEDPKRIFYLAQTAVLLISMTLSLLFIIFSSPIAAGLSIPGKSNYIIFLAIIMFMDAIVAIPFARLRLEKKPFKFALARIVNVIILVGLNIYFFVIADKTSVSYVFLANLYANAFYLIFFAPTLLQWRPIIDKTILPSMLIYAYPVMLTGLAGMINEMFSRWCLEWWLPKDFYPGKSSLYALGVFAAAYKYAVFMSLTIQAFRFAAEPFFFSNAAEKNSPELFAKVNHFFIIVCSFILLAVSINMDILKYLLGGKEYYPGLTVVPILLLGYLFLGVYYNFSIWFKLTDRTYFGTIITVGGVIITITLNYFLIPISGYVGSSWATLICYFAMAAVCYFLGQTYYPIPYKNLRSISYILLSLILIATAHLWSFSSLILDLAFHLFFLIIYLAIAVLLEKRLPFTSPSKNFVL